MDQIEQIKEQIKQTLLSRAAPLQFSAGIAGQALLATLFNSLVPLIPFLCLQSCITRPQVLQALLSFAAGSLLHEVGEHLLPEAIKLEKKSLPFVAKITSSHHNHSHSSVALIFISGLIFFYAFQLLINLVLNDRQSEHDHHNKKSGAFVGLFSDFTHNFTDGVAIAISFSISPKQGLSTALAMLAHELPHELSDLAVLIKSGYLYKDALRMQLVTALGAFLGCCFVLMLGRMSAYTKMTLISLTSSGFAYLVLADILPDLRMRVNSLQDAFVSLFFMIAGTFCSKIFENLSH